MKLIALKTFRHGSRTFRRGSPVKLSDAQVKPLMAKKMVGEAKAAPQKQQSEPKNNAKKSAPKNKSEQP